MPELAPFSPPLAGRPLLIGFSGGLDSTVLLHRLATDAHAGLGAIHVHHGLHADADAWAAHCATVCAALHVPLDIAHVDVDRRSGRGIEAAAREARHAAFAAALADDEILVLAHHRDDQAETFLLRALRGSGVDGLGAMRPWRAFAHGWLWRPLLETARSELFAYAQRHDLRWIEDPGNNDSAFDRNFIRHHAMPLLRERWPHADAAFARSAMLSAAAGALLDDEDARSLGDLACGDARTLRVDGLRMLPAARRARVLRRWIDGLALPPLPAQAFARVDADLLGAAADARAEFAWAGAAIRRWRNLLHADRQREPLPPDWRVSWDGRAPLSLPDGGTLRLSGASGFDAPLEVMARRGGERIRLPGRAHTHSLKHVLQDLGVPPWQRARLPLLLSSVDGQVLGVADRVYAAELDGWLRSRDAGLLFEPG